MKYALVSIIIPVFNRCSVVGETIENVIRQTYENWECIIVDDGSTDNTPELINLYSEKDYRIKYFSRPKYYKKGASSSRNFGIKKSKGEYLQFLDSDDLISPNKLEMQILSLRNNSTKVACCSWKLFRKDSRDASIINLLYSNGNYASCAFLKSMGVKNVFFPPHTYLVPKEIIKKAGNWNEELTNNDDAEFFGRVILASSGIIYNANCTAYYRKSGSDHLSNYSSVERIKSAIKSWELIENQIREKCEEGTLIYISNAKHWLFQAVKNRFPYEVFKQRRFFKQEFEKESFRLQYKFIALKLLRNRLSRIKRKILANE